jgi:hydroxyethylthiazole kinase-like uncharacterized protein yjeF
MNILSAAQMRAVDRMTVERSRIPWLTLMEGAGAQVVNLLTDLMKKEETAGRSGPVRFLVISGKGNNGGDGAVIARQIRMRNLGRVELVLVAELEEVTGEARTNMEIVRSLGELDDLISFHASLSAWPAWSSGKIDPAGLVVVDALFGTGLTRPVEGECARVIGLINGLRQQGALVVAVDIPSGLPSDSGVPNGPHVVADYTVTFTAPKPGNVLAPAAAANGRLLIAPIGTPERLVEEVVAEGLTEPLELVESHQVQTWLNELVRNADVHKGAVGNVLLLAGAPGRTGAAALAAGSVLRAGAGLATVATPASAIPLLVAQADVEVMTVPLPETSTHNLSSGAWEVFESLLIGRDLVAVGPGIRSDEIEVRSLLKRLVENRRQPLIIDADGLNALAPWPEELHGSDALPVIVTPHPGEMARLTGSTTAEIQRDRVAAARMLARRNHLIVVLKGARTVIADPQGRVYVNPTGNPGMATAGSGDVLTGLLAGLLAQRPVPVIEAVLAGVWLHGLAGDLAAARFGIRSMIASNIRDLLGEAMKVVRGADLPVRMDWRRVL